MGKIQGPGCKMMMEMPSLANECFFFQNSYRKSKYHIQAVHPKKEYPSNIGLCTNTENLAPQKPLTKNFSHFFFSFKDCHSFSRKNEASTRSARPWTRRSSASPFSMMASAPASRGTPRHAATGAAASWGNGMAADWQRMAAFPNGPWGKRFRKGLGAGNRALVDHPLYIPLVKPFNRVLGGGSRAEKNTAGLELVPPLRDVVISCLIWTRSCNAKSLPNTPLGGGKGPSRAVSFPRIYLQSKHLIAKPQKN